MWLPCIRFSRLVLPVGLSVATVTSALENTAVANGVGYAAVKAFLNVTLAHLHSACVHAGLRGPTPDMPDEPLTGAASRLVARVALLCCRLGGRDGDKELLRAFAELCVATGHYRLALALIDRVLSGPSRCVGRRAVPTHAAAR